jgi:zeta-carotene desaturase
VFSVFLCDLCGYLRDPIFTMTHYPGSNSVLVIGAGLAGMSAAVALHAAGYEVTLVEASRRLGGRAASHSDPRGGGEFDACQHVLLGCCTNLLDFYERVGVSHLIRFEPAVRFMGPDGRVYDLGATQGIPAPYHLTAALLRFHLLTLSERAALARAVLAMLRIPREQRNELDDLPFSDFLARHRQPESLLHKLYIPILLGSLNEDPRHASARYAIQVFQDALLAHADGAPLGVSRVPLSQLYQTLPIPKDHILLNTRIASTEFRGSRISALLTTTGQRLTAGHYLFATNFPNTLKLLSPAALQLDPRLPPLSQIRSVPILGAHLTFDRPILPHSHVALVEGSLQWLFRDERDPRILHGVISAAREYDPLPPREQVLQSFLAQIHHHLPQSRGAKLLDAHIVTEKRATFAALPGVDRLRPAQAPPSAGIANLYLAGDYTRTGWPATMEGAVRSGYLAAEGISGKRFLVEDLKTQWPSALAGLGGQPVV